MTVEKGTVLKADEVKTVDVKFFYTNHRGEQSWRHVRPSYIKFGFTVWHPVPQWLLVAYDHVKLEVRTFAMKDITMWEPEA